MNKVSIIIPARNEEQYISKCIDSILEQSYPQELIEIIIVDGQSTDNTAGIIKNYSKKYINVRLIFNGKMITPISLNIGIKNSVGDIIIILGAHSFIDKDFVKNNVRNLTEKDADCSGGIIETINNGSVAQSIALAMSSPFGVGNALFRYSKEECYVDTVAFGAYKRSTLDKIGYFDEELVRNQDDEINLRLSKSGGRILLSPDIKSYYYSRSSLVKLWNQYKQYGFWKVRVIQKHKRPAAIRHLVPIAFVLSLFGLGIMSFFNKYIFYMLVLELGLYFILDLLFSLKQSIKDKLELFPYLVLIFPILHISYGIGFLSGLINFYIYKNKKTINKNTSVSR